MRADLLTAAIVVGYTHSRYYVMGVAAKLVEAAKGANELAAFAKVLKEHSDEISFIGDYVDRSELHPSLRHFFRSLSRGNSYAVRLRTAPRPHAARII